MAKTNLCVGPALKHHAPGILDLWDEFSRRSAKYQPGECARIWAGLQPKGDVT